MTMVTEKCGRSGEPFSCEYYRKLWKKKLYGLKVSSWHPN